MTANHTDDLQLLARIKAGESRAFDQLFLKYYPNLLHFCRSLLPYPSDEGEDVVLEVFQQVWRHREKMNIHSSLSAFLYASVKNRVYDYRRKQHPGTNMPLEEIPGELIANRECPDQVLTYKELSESLEKLIKLLPERMQLIFRMNREDQLTYQEIANLLEISVNSVKTQMYRAIKFLKESYRFDNPAS